MALRWRKTGALVCATKSVPMDGDTYIDDRLHYQLSVISRCIIADVQEDTNGHWYWLHDGDKGPYLRGRLEETL